AERLNFTPTIAAVSPSSGSSAGGQSVTISGTGFLSGQTTIKFGTKKATAVSCTSWDVTHPAVETTCTVTSPSHSAETVNVRATVSKAISATTPADRYTYS